MKGLVLYFIKKIVLHEYPEHVLLRIFLFTRILSEPLENQLTEVSEVYETLPRDVVWNINHLLL